MNEQLCKTLFEMNIKLAKTHPWYEGFKNELEDTLDKCLSYENKFLILNCFLSVKIEELEKIVKETGENMH